MLVWLSVPIAVLPALVLLGGVWWLDRHDRERLTLFGLAFGWGAVGGILIALRGSGPLAELLSGVLDSEAWRLSTVLVAPLVEEPAKALVLLLLVRAAAFDSTTDGFVFGAATGLGFGLTENLMYFRASAGGADGALFAGIVALRTLYSALMHASASSVIGAALGYAKFRNGRNRWFALGGALALALGIHALWNGLLLAGMQGSLAIGLLDFVLFPIELAVLVGVFRLSLLDESRIIERELAEEVDLGVIPGEHLEFLRAYRRRARPTWLPDRMDSGAYVRRATALAFRKHQLKVNAEPGYYADEISALRHEIVVQLNAAGIAPSYIPILDETALGAAEPG